MSDHDSDTMPDIGIEQAQARIQAALARLSGGLPVELAPLADEVRAICVAVEALAATGGMDKARRFAPALSAMAESLDVLEAGLQSAHDQRFPHKDPT